MGKTISSFVHRFSRPKVSSQKGNTDNIFWPNLSEVHTLTTRDHMTNIKMTEYLLQYP